MDIQALFDAGMINAIDLCFARLVMRMDKDAGQWTGLAAALVSRATAQGDVCLDLESVCQKGIPHAGGMLSLGEKQTARRWREAILKSPLIGEKDFEKIMILDGYRLYLQRYWRYESRVAEGITARCTRAPVDPSDRVDTDGFHPGWMKGDPVQQRAMAAALNQWFTVISGGPGTGKTVTIAAIISLLITRQLAPAQRILLAAPTGKAAARLQEALESALRSFPDDNPCRHSCITAQTVHRLLGAIPDGSRFRHDADNPLAADVVIIDEASMIDLALMSRLMDAVPASARLILVGDKDQLASVEAGAVLGDICGGPAPRAARKAAPDDAPYGVAESSTDRAPALISDHIVVLQNNYRFGENSGIHRLGQAVRQGDAESAFSLLNDPRFADVSWKALAPDADLEAELREKTLTEVAPLFSIDALPDLIARLMGFKILTAVRKGPLGVASLNSTVERILKANGFVAAGSGSDDAWYRGKPVMITRNDYHQSLFNGDIGVAVARLQGGPADLQVAFESAGGTIRYIVPEQLPPHETVYAMTIHKSQGTEFDKVLLILPRNDSPLLTRELIYTAITRARRSVEIWSREDVFKNAVDRCINRASGLRDTLWNGRRAAADKDDSGE